MSSFRFAKEVIPQYICSVVVADLLEEEARIEFVSCRRVRVITRNMKLC